MVEAVISCDVVRPLRIALQLRGWSQPQVIIVSRGQGCSAARIVRNALAVRLHLGRAIRKAFTETNAHSRRPALTCVRLGFCHLIHRRCPRRNSVGESDMSASCCCRCCPEIVRQLAAEPATECGGESIERYFHLPSKNVRLGLSADLLLGPPSQVGQEYARMLRGGSCAHQA